MRGTRPPRGTGSTTRTWRRRSAGTTCLWTFPTARGAPARRRQGAGGVGDPRVRRRGREAEARAGRGAGSRPPRWPGRRGRRRRDGARRARTRLLPRPRACRSVCVGVYPRRAARQRTAGLAEGSRLDKRRARRPPRGRHDGGGAGRRGEGSGANGGRKDGGGRGRGERTEARPSDTMKPKPSIRPRPVPLVSLEPLFRWSPCARSAGRRAPCPFDPRTVFDPTASNQSLRESVSFFLPSERRAYAGTRLNSTSLELGR